MNFWLVLDAKRWPPAISKEIEWQNESSLPISADILLKTVIQLVNLIISFNAPGIALKYFPGV